MYFVGISGPIASGKSTLAKQLSAEFNHSAIIPFAAGVKYLASLYNNPSALYEIAGYFTTLHISNDVAMKAAWMIMDAYRKYPTEDGRKNRQLLQYIGTEVGREFIHKDIWIKDMEWRSFTHPDPYLDIVFCDDVRFLNESEFVNVHIAIDVESSSELTARYIQRIQTFPKEYTYSNHASEQQQLSFPDFCVPIEFTHEDVLAAKYFIEGGLL